MELVLIEGEPDQATDEVTAATARLSWLGIATVEEHDTTCCYARQDKAWVHGPGREPWEVYTVKADAPDAVSVRIVNRSGPCACGSPAADGVELSVQRETTPTGG